MNANWPSSSTSPSTHFHLIYWHFLCRVNVMVIITKNMITLIQNHFGFFTISQWKNNWSPTADVNNFYFSQLADWLCQLCFLTWHPESFRVIHCPSTLHIVAGQRLCQACTPVSSITSKCFYHTWAKQTVSSMLRSCWKLMHVAHWCQHVIQ